VAQLLDRYDDDDDDDDEEDDKVSWITFINFIV